ncbi:MAG: hypothetical protein WBA10_04040 [Elainellaceae cyanobacterium]
MTHRESGAPLFNSLTPLGFYVRVSTTYWNIITQTKHPIMANRLSDVEICLSTPDKIRRSRSDFDVYLFYRQEREGRWICAVARRLNGDGFLITTYPTDTIKAGERIWQK